MLLETTTSVEVKGDTSRCSARRLLIVTTATLPSASTVKGFAYVLHFLKRMDSNLEARSSAFHQLNVSEYGIPFAAHGHYN